MGVSYSSTYPTAVEQSAVYDDGMMSAEFEVEFAQNGTPFSHSCNPGASVMAETIAPKSNMMAYINRVEVEFLHDGHAEQQSEQAVPVQQHANYIHKMIIKLSKHIVV